MTDTPETPAQAKARRRRWISFAELVAVLGLVISALSFWDSHSGRVAQETAKPAPAHRAPLVLTATPDADGRTLKLASASSSIVIQTQTISFPEAIGAAPVEIVGNPRIDGDWFAARLHALAHGKGDAPRRLPIGIVTRSLDHGELREDRAIYDIGFRWRPRFMRDDAAALEGITLVARGQGDLQKRLDARWAALHPAEK